ncbi:MAG: hypothetical protein EOM76_09085, partial [Sphingobacteriia bacterium]|nr:hypothetical protein [Sphingobacteriia bacterium]
EDFIKKLVSRSFIQSLEFALPDQKDHQTHTLEIALPALENGEYMLFASNGKNFDVENNIFAYKNFRISRITYLTRSLTDGSTELAVRDRENGKPIEGATVEAYENKYNSFSRKYENVLHSRQKTNVDGICLFKAPSAKTYGQNLSFIIINGKDKLDPNDAVYQYYRDTTTKTSIQTNFFTDRAIYRPGQNIYFKGIMVEYRGSHSSIVANKKSTVRFFDANYQEVATVDVVTNDFGSFSGSFVAPSGGLNGQMRIQNETGTAYFRVEEYKRPKFEVKFLPVTGSYRLNETVKITGEAKAYAGNSIDGASVKYRVTRRASYPWWRWWWGSMPNSTEMAITNGEMTSDENGKFEIAFKAIPDFATKKTTMPVFTYTIYADVTDINGETHSATQSVSVGYISMYANAAIPSQIDINQKEQKYDIRTTNLNGQLDPAKISVTVHQLKQPNSFLKNRYWQRPDQFVMTEAEYKAIFPNDLYANEDEKMSWEKSKKVYDKIHHTSVDTILIFSDIYTWTAGDYLLEINGKDNFGMEFSKSLLFKVYNNNSTQNSSMDALSVFETQRIYKPGETAQIVLATKLQNATILFEKEQKGKIVSKEWISLNDEQKILKIPISSEDIDDFRCHFTLVADNRAYTQIRHVSVPDNSKQLDVVFETFRDKLSPGQEEEWRLKVKGNEGDKLLAEILTGMYDASLDAFVNHYWSFYPLRRNYSSISWNVGRTYNSITSDRYVKRTPYFNKVYKYYENLNWFGFNLYGYGRGHYSNSYRRSKISTDREETLEDDVVESEVFAVAEQTAGITTKSDKSPTTSTFKTFDDDGIMAGEKDEDIQDQTIDSRNNTSNNQGGFEDVKVRTNFNETAFFMPHVSTDEQGNAVIKFTVPESLTRWKIMGIAHTQDLKFGSFNKALITQKELMVFPNAPRFFRDGDQVSFSVKISNISDKDLSGFAKIEFFDALTMKPINDLMNHQDIQKTFVTKQRQSTQVNWNISIPQGIMAITYRVKAYSGNFSDGEENTLPVLTNRMLVTESMPMPINGNQKKAFVFDKMKNTTSTTLKHFRYTLEFTSNPAWYAVQALPYLMEYPYDCSEQIFSRYYANSIATFIANSSPKIKAVFGKQNSK